MQRPLAVLALCLVACAAAAKEPNLRIDMASYLDVSVDAARHRHDRRVDVATFERMAREPGTIVLDARSREKFDLLHVDGAVNLSFPDITEASLAALIPDRTTRVLIYCNNNFVNDEIAFPTKRADASLNLSTYIALYSYGYRNVYELGPLLDVRTERGLALVGSSR